MDERNAKVPPQTPPRPPRMRPAMVAAVGGMVTALTVGCLWMGGILPSGRLGFVFLAALFVAPLTVERQYVPALVVYVAAALLALFVLPNKGVAVFYLAFFGYWLCLRGWVMERFSPVVAFVARWLVFAVALTLVLLFGRQLIYTGEIQTWMWFVGIAAAQVIFVVVDAVYGQLLKVYVQEIHSRLLHR